MLGIIVFANARNYSRAQARFVRGGHRVASFYYLLNRVGGAVAVVLGLLQLLGVY